MSIKSDRWIRSQCVKEKYIIGANGNIPFDKPMIDPFVGNQESIGKISYGLSSYGYDIRVADEFRIFTNIHSSIIDPKNFDAKLLQEVKGVDHILIPPNSFCLARTVEWFRIPRNILALCIGKSTYRRCGIVCDITPFEPEWEGYATMEISNTSPSPAKIYSNEGIAQVLFFESDDVCQISYKDKKGKYHNQIELTLPMVSK